MEDLLNVAEFLRKQLEEVERKMKDLNVQEMKRLVAEKDTDPKWKDFVLKPFGVIDNIISILDDTYDSLFDMVKEYSEKDPNLVLGHLNSTTWKNFQLCVINTLLDPKKYDESYDFEDTASGCDEVVWSAAYDILID
jgi:hypothetical protein